MPVSSIRPGFSILLCPDSTLLLEHVSEMLDEYPSSSGKWERHIWWGDELPDSKFWESLEQKVLFPVYRAVIIRRVQEWPAAIWKYLSVALSRGHDEVWPILCVESPFERGAPKIPAFVQKSKCYLHAEKSGWIWKRAPLSGTGLTTYVRKQAEKKGLRFAPGCLDLFCYDIASDAASINNELEKLALASSDGLIQQTMLNLDSSSPESDAFRCVRMLLAGNVAGVWQEMKRNADSSLLFFLLALVAREFRLYWQIVSGLNPGMPPKDAPARKALAMNLGHTKIAKAFALLADAEWQVKSGRQTPEQTLEQLVVNLTNLCS